MQRLHLLVERQTEEVLHGPLSIEALGLGALRTRCPHLDAWLADLERRTDRAP